MGAYIRALEKVDLTLRVVSNSVFLTKDIGTIAPPAC
jgi:hypothetical protein